MPSENVPKECPRNVHGSSAVTDSASSTYCSRCHGGSQVESPCPRWSSASTWKRSDSRSASGRKWRPWLVTPCRQTSAGDSGSPHSWTAIVTRLLGLGGGQAAGELPAARLALLHERPHDRPLLVDQERAADRCADGLVEDAVGAR